MATDQAEQPRQDTMRIVRHELADLAANCAYRAECQITAAGFWGNLQLFLGASAAVTAGVAGASAFSKQSIVAGSFAVAAAALSAILASIKPGERAAQHEHTANEFNLLAEAATRAHELAARHGSDPDEVQKQLDDLVDRRDALARRAPFVNRRLCRLAESFLDKDQGYFPVRGRKDRPKFRGFLRRLLPF